MEQNSMFMRFVKITDYGENKTFYRVKMEDGKKMYVWDKVAQIIE